jgi:serine/threonine protein kinase/HAMP domain-containing protein
MSTEAIEVASLQERIRHLEKVVELERLLRQQLKEKSAAAQTDRTLAQPHVESALVARNKTNTTVVIGPRPPTVQGDAGPLEVGSRLFEYRIDEVLGQGGFGITYLATDVHLNVKVAIKEYLPSSFALRKKDKTVIPRAEQDADFYQTWLDNFLMEARTLATFRHSHIVRVARFFEANNTAYMVLEYEHGKALSDWWKDQGGSVTTDAKTLVVKGDKSESLPKEQSPSNRTVETTRSKPGIPEKDLLALFHPLLDGLAAVHAAGYLHRDIKPDNIYVRSSDGSLVLLDFGSACNTADGARESGFVYTPGFAPHEQYVGGNQGPWTDIYAIGATLYWLVTGKKPPPVPVRQEDPDPLVPAVEAGQGRYSPEFLQAIDWALKMDPSERPQTMAEFCRVLFAHHAASLGLLEALSDGHTNATLQPDQHMRASLISRARTRVGNFWKSLFNPASWPLKGKLTVSLVGAALLPMLITAQYNLTSGVALTSSSELRNLERFAESTAGRVSQLINDSRHMATYLGTDADFVALLSQPSDSTADAVAVKLSSLLKANPDVRLLTLMNDKGTIVASSDPAVVGRSFEFRDYFKEAMAGRSHMTGIIVGSDGTSGVYYSHPVFDTSGKVLGLVLLRIRGDTVNAILKMVGGNDSARKPFLIDEDGVLVLHPDANALYRSLTPLSPEAAQRIASDQRFRVNKVESLDMPDLANAMVGAAKPGNIRYQSTLTSTAEIAGYAPVPGTRWVVGVTESLERFEAPLNQLFLNVLYSVVVVGLIFFVLATLLAKSLVRPILRLTEAAEALKQGKYDQATVSVTNNDELGRLARTFNIMIDILRQRERERSRR